MVLSIQPMGLSKVIILISLTRIGHNTSLDGYQDALMKERRGRGFIPNLLGHFYCE